MSRNERATEKNAITNEWKKSEAVISALCVIDATRYEEKKKNWNWDMKSGTYEQKAWSFTRTSKSSRVYFINETRISKSICFFFVFHFLIRYYWISLLSIKFHRFIYIHGTRTPNNQNSITIPLLGFFWYVYSFPSFSWLFIVLLSMLIFCVCRQREASKQIESLRTANCFLSFQNIFHEINQTFIESYLSISKFDERSVSLLILFLLFHTRFFPNSNH